MGVALFISRKGTAEPAYYSLTGDTGWETVWLPAAAALELDLIPRLGDGTFTTVPPDSLPVISSQLGQLRVWMAANGYELYVEHLDDVLYALAKMRPGEEEASFG